MMRVRFLGSVAVLLGLLLVGAGRSSALPGVVDIASSSGLNAYGPQETYSAMPYDYDLDGRTDVLIGYHDNQAKLWRNVGRNRFTWVARDAFPGRTTSYVIDRHDCAWGDANTDGLPDVYCVTGRAWPLLFVKDAGDGNELWLQQPNHTFVNVAARWGLLDPYGRGRSALFFDANNDGCDDLYVANERPEANSPDGGQQAENKFFKNRCLGLGFDSAPQYGLNQVIGHGRCLTAFDYNEDGWRDLLVCGSDYVHLYLNVAGETFVDVSSQTTAKWAKTYADFRLLDVNNDGHLDFVGINWNYVEYRLWQREKTGLPSFAAPIAILRFPSAGWHIAVGDADGNGLKDIFVLRSYKTNANDYLVLNRGYDWTLRTSVMTIPVAPGLGDDVESIPLANGRSGFIELEGRDDKVANQRLLAYTP